LSKHTILTPVGSAGDVNPFIMLGGEMRRRGHRVTVMAPDVFRGVIADAGLEFASTGTREEFDEATNNPELWDARRGPRVVFREIVRHMRRAYDVLERLYVPDETLVVGHPLSVFTRVFEETHRVPAATVHLAPTVFRSDFQLSVLPSGHDISNWPRWGKRTLWWAVDRFAVDPHLVPALNAWRREFGLAPMSRIFKSWIHSPQLVLGLFPEWFAQPQADWPAQLRLTGFVLSDERAAGLLPQAEQQWLERFLNDGPAPIVFTPGSANRHAAAFFQAGIEAAARMGQRALLVTPYREHLPSSLPPGIGYLPHAPFSTLFPRVAAVVHHGGIGTSAQVLAAGVPQLVMPMGFDQPDNAARLERLGVGGTVYPKHFSASIVASTLERLLTSEAARIACESVRGRMNSDLALTCAGDLLEKRAGRV
jgi:rhamnosyltransferase subunit B